MESETFSINANGMNLQIEIKKKYFFFFLKSKLVKIL